MMDILVMRTDKNPNLFSETGNIDFLQPKEHIEPAKKRFISSLLHAINDSGFTDLEMSDADNLVAQSFSNNGWVTIDWINETLIKNLIKPAIVVGILRVISQLSREQLRSFGHTMVTMVILYNNNHLQNEEVAEAIIRCMENWKDKEFYKILGTLKVDVNYLNQYKEFVLEELTN